MAVVEGVMDFALRVTVRANRLPEIVERSQFSTLTEGKCWLEPMLSPWTP